MAVSPADPRLRHAGFARLIGDGVDYTVRKYSVVLGRPNKTLPVDVVLASAMSVSRQHARIYYNFETRQFELEVLGKNGVAVDGVQHEAGGPPVPLKSKALLQIGTDVSFHFLLPKKKSKVLEMLRNGVEIGAAHPSGADGGAGGGGGDPPTSAPAQRMTTPEQQAAMYAAAAAAHVQQRQAQQQAQQQQQLAMVAQALAWQQQAAMVAQAQAEAQAQAQQNPALLQGLIDQIQQAQQQQQMQQAALAAMAGLSPQQQIQLLLQQQQAQQQQYNGTPPGSMPPQQQ